MNSKNDVKVTLHWLLPFSFFAILFVQEIIPVGFLVIMGQSSVSILIPSFGFLLYMIYCISKVKTRRVELFSLEMFYAFLMVYYLLVVAPLVVELTFSQVSELCSTGSINEKPKSLTMFYIALVLNFFIGKALCAGSRTPLKKRTYKTAPKTLPPKPKPLVPVTSNGNTSSLSEKALESSVPIVGGGLTTHMTSRFLSPGHVGFSKMTGSMNLGHAGCKLFSLAMGVCSSVLIQRHLSEIGRSTTHQGNSVKGNPDNLSKDDTANNLIPESTGYWKWISISDGSDPPSLG
jgi:hypothetical protein